MINVTHTHALRLHLRVTFKSLFVEPCVTETRGCTFRKYIILAIFYSLKLYFCPLYQRPIGKIINQQEDIEEQTSFYYVKMYNVLSVGILIYLIIQFLCSKLYSHIVESKANTLDTRVYGVRNWKKVSRNSE